MAIRNKDFTKGLKSVTVSGYKTRSDKINLTVKTGKTYYVRIRTILKSGSHKYYSLWSDIRTVKYVKPEDRISVSKVKKSGISDKNYTGKARTLSLKLTYKGDTLKKNRDYIVSYSGNKKVGKATVKITGIGNYKGTVKNTYRIRPLGSAIKKLTPGQGSVTIKWNKRLTKMSGSRIRGYQIAISTSKSFTSATTRKIKYKGYETNEKTIGKLVPGNTYYVRIRTYIKVDGKTYYSFWSKYKKVTI